MRYCVALVDPNSQVVHGLVATARTTQKGSSESKENAEMHILIDRTGQCITSIASPCWPHVSSRSRHALSSVSAAAAQEQRPNPMDCQPSVLSEAFRFHGTKLQYYHTK